MNNSRILSKVSSKFKKVDFHIAFFAFAIALITPTIQAQLNMQSGTFTGDGLDNRVITGLTFQPDVVIIKGWTENAIIKTNTMAGNQSKPFVSGPTISDGIKTLDATGFTVGTNPDVNWSGETYYWVAIQQSALLQTGTYTGDGVDNRDITGLSLNPEIVMLMREDASQPLWRTSLMGINVTYDFLSSGARTNRIQNFGANYFEIGDDASVNQAGAVYHYLAFEKNERYVDASNYEGDGVDNRTLKGADFNPDFLIVKRAGSNAFFATPELPADETMIFSNGANATNLIQNVQGFEIGDDIEINQNAELYQFMAFSGSGSLPVEWVYFDAEVDGDDVVLNWETASESANLGFEIQWSTVADNSNDFLNYEKIGFINGRGNSTTLNSYGFRANDMGKGSHKFRIKQIDTDGITSFSNEAMVEISMADAPDISRIYPNPSNDFIRLDLYVPDATDLKFRIINAQGIQITESIVTPNAGVQFTKEFDVSQFAQGIYYLNIFGENFAEVRSFSIMK